MTFLGFFIIKVEKNNKIKTISTLQDVLDLQAFYPTQIIFVNRFLSIALNKSKTKIALIENFNPKNPDKFNYREIALSFIEKIEKGPVLKIHYIQKGEIKILNVYPVNNEIKEFFHNIFELSLYKRLEARLPQNRFDLYSSSDWECGYLWAFANYNSTFAFFKTGQKAQINKINLRKEHFTIDTKFKYFEAPIFGIPSQLSIYNPLFLQSIYSFMIKTIKDKCAKFVADSIYYDNYSNIVYLTNGLTSLQSVILDKIDEVFYRDNRISFSLYGEDRVINYIASQQQISDFENFIIDYNLKKIAQSFDYKTDKLINITPYTKFIIDSSRNRLIYCANLNKLSSFSYIFIPFNHIKDLKIEKSGLKHFIRIKTFENETIDITCDKKEVAQYIEAQIVKLIR